MEESGRREKEAATQTEERDEEQEEEEGRRKCVRKEREERDMGVQVEETDPELFNFDQEVGNILDKCVLRDHIISIH